MAICIQCGQNVRGLAPCTMDGKGAMNSEGMTICNRCIYGAHTDKPLMTDSEYLRLQGFWYIVPGEAKSVSL
jgi:hypothetical protein